MKTFTVRAAARQTDEKAWDAGSPVAGDMREFTLPVGEHTLARSIYLSGLFPSPALCAGLGRCGRCRVRYLSDPPPVLEKERDVLSHHDLDNGWRLSCLREASPGIHVALPGDHVPGGIGAAEDASRKQDFSGVPYALAVDLGTTSVWWRALGPDGPDVPAGLQDGEAHPADGRHANPQMGAGSDVISRLAYASGPPESGGLERLRGLALTDLFRVARGYGAFPASMCVAANPAMVYILLGKDVTGLARAPYALSYAGGTFEDLAEPDGEGHMTAWIAPLVSPFIGGDISAGYASLAFDPTGTPPEYPFVLADLGTNGELVLALSPHEALAASVAMGPALEGINLNFGMDASFGAVTGYRVTAMGLEPQVLGETAPRGITGTGYLSLLHALKATGMLSEEGFFLRPGVPGRPAVHSFPLARRLDGPRSACSGEDDSHEHHAPAREEDRLRLPGKMYITAGDVEELLKAKAAFSLALARLLTAAGLAAADIKTLYLAGALGYHLAPRSLEDLGFLPQGMGSRVRTVGNSSLAGAALLARNSAAREQTVAWTHSVRTVNLADDASFAADFAARMRFSW